MELALRYNDIKNDIRRSSLPAETRKLFLTAEMEEEVLEFSEIMEVCHTVLLYLQNCIGEECTMNEIRTFFDTLATFLCCASMRTLSTKDNSLSSISLSISSIKNT